VLHRRQLRPALDQGCTQNAAPATAAPARGLAVGAKGAGGARVAVIGCGAIGLVCAATALSGGAGRVEVTDLSPARLAAARRPGAQVAGPGLSGEYDVVMDAEDFAQAMARIGDWDLTWAVGYPLAAAAGIFTDLMNGGLHPLKALLRP